MALRARADALQAEAGTWALLEHLHAEPDERFPGGHGGRALPGAGDELTLSQRIAHLLATMPELNWRVVQRDWGLRCQTIYEPKLSQRIAHLLATEPELNWRVVQCDWGYWFRVC